MPNINISEKLSNILFSTLVMFVGFDPYNLISNLGNKRGSYCMSENIELHIWGFEVNP